MLREEKVEKPDTEASAVETKPQTVPEAIAKTSLEKEEEEPHSSSPATSPAPSSDGEAADYQEIEFEFGRYIGEVDPLTELRCGQGTLHYHNGNTYTGEWKDGAAHGFGEKTYKNGDVFRGMWVEGKRCGRGSYLHNEGHFFEGMYEDDYPNGYGVLTTVSGDRYMGEWKKGLKWGKGREILKSGQVFAGTWREGKKQGIGKLFVPGAKRYIAGVWHEDKFLRELTEEEKETAQERDAREESELGNTLPETASTPTGLNAFEALADRAVKALEDKLEAWGKALESATLGDTEPSANAAEEPEVKNGVVEE